MEKKLAWSEQRVLESDDVDVFRRLRATRLTKYLQEIAWNHAKAIGVGYDSEKFKDIHWVLVRLEININGPLPQWGQTMNVHTQPAGIEKFFALREFILEVETPEGVQEFCRATSSWVIINGETRRIQRPKPFIEDLLLPETRRALDTTAQKITFDPLTQWGKSATLRAGYNDIDLHDHVNNGKYLEWFLSGLEREFFEEKEVAKIELNFLSEVGWGDVLESQLSFFDEEVTCHRIRKVDRDTQFEEPSALGKIFWKPRALHHD